jgi:hypothetical protein
MRAGEADETDDQARSNDLNRRSGRDGREYDGDQSETELGGGTVVLHVGVAHGGEGDAAQHVTDLTGDSSGDDPLSGVAVNAHGHCQQTRHHQRQADGAGSSGHPSHLPSAGLARSQPSPRSVGA